MEVEEDRVVQEPLDVAPGAESDLFQLRPPRADDDPLLRVPLHGDVGADEPLPLFPFLELDDLDGRRVRNLVVAGEEDLLPDPIWKRWLKLFI